MGLALVALSRRRVLGSATTMRLPYEHFSQVVSEPPHKRRTRLPLEAVRRARLGEAGAEEAEMLRSEGLLGPKRAEKARSAVLTSEVRRA